MRSRGLGPVVGGRALLLVAVTALSAGAAPAAGETVTVVATRDATLFQDTDGDTASGAGPALFAGMNSQRNIRRALVRFDLADRVPRGSRVVEAELKLLVLNAPNRTVQPMTVHRLLGDWGEGESFSEGGLGDAATTGDATWIHAFFPGTPWRAPGGDFEPEASAAANVPPEGPVAWTGALLVDDVQAWIDEPESAFGWLLRGEETEPASARRFGSREDSDPADRPALVVKFIPPDRQRESTWGREKARWRTPRSGN